VNTLITTLVTELISFTLDEDLFATGQDLEVDWAEERSEQDIVYAFSETHAVKTNTLCLRAYTVPINRLGAAEVMHLNDTDHELRQALSLLPQY
jgi:hypothetical protein